MFSSLIVLTKADLIHSILYHNLRTKKLLTGTRGAGIVYLEHSLYRCYRSREGLGCLVLLWQTHLGCKKDFSSY